MSPDIKWWETTFLFIFSIDLWFDLPPPQKKNRIWIDFKFLFHFVSVSRCEPNNSHINCLYIYSLNVELLILNQLKLEKLSPAPPISSSLIHSRIFDIPSSGSTKNVAWCCSYISIPTEPTVVMAQLVMGSGTRKPEPGENPDFFGTRPVSEKWYSNPTQTHQ